MIWYLESRIGESRHWHRVPVAPLPFRMGRRWDLPMVVPSPLVSWQHAEIVEEGGQLILRDLGSANGTSVNGHRIAAPTPLAEGDVILLAQSEFRFGKAASYSELRKTTSNLLSQSLPRSFVQQAIRFGEMMRAKAVNVVFQPIVSLRDGHILGYEALGRGNHATLPQSPAQLFEIAGRLGVSADLSHMLRVRACELASGLPEGSPLFANTHPAELDRPEHLLAAMRALKQNAPPIQLTLEVHEGSVASVQAMRELRDQLRELGVRLAYDDFGAGQSRLIELAEVTPDVLKFDLAMIRGLDQASPGRRAVISSQLRMATDLGILTVAEGVENEATLAACRELGFDAAQGYHYGQPAPASQFGHGTPSPGR
jgi:EAL domain-containing protein (putative c-di-GMP-specific phosphodiesterase class I)